MPLTHAHRHTDTRQHRQHRHDKLHFWKDTRCLVGRRNNLYRFLPSAVFRQKKWNKNSYHIRYWPLETTISHPTSVLHNQVQRYRITGEPTYELTLTSYLWKCLKLIWIDSFWATVTSWAPLSPHLLVAMPAAMATKDWRPSRRLAIWLMHHLCEQKYSETSGYMLPVIRSRYYPVPDRAKLDSGKASFSRHNPATSLFKCVISKDAVDC